MMDWYVIQHLYPKAYEHFVNKMFPNTGIISNSILKFFDIRKLYSFFDKEEIYLTIEMYNPYQWVFSICNNYSVTFGPFNGSKESRLEIEIEGFTCCFQTLEKKITDKKK